jgi:type II secretory pathway pseudopilin PulG
MNLNRTIIQQGVPKRPSPKSAFTFVELLVTMVMAALLALSIRPGIANTKTNAKVARCQNNLRQFTVGWSMYAADYGDRVPNNFGPEDIISAIQSKRLDNWANNVMTWGMGPGLSDASNTNRTWIGLLGQYVASNDNIYHCPSDNYLSSAQVAARFSHRVRSISMNAVFGRYSIGADETASGKNALLPEYMQYLKQSQIHGVEDFTGSHIFETQLDRNVSPIPGGAPARQPGSVWIKHIKIVLEHSLQIFGHLRNGQALINDLRQYFVRLFPFAAGAEFAPMEFVRQLILSGRRQGVGFISLHVAQHQDCDRCPRG